MASEWLERHSVEPKQNTLTVSSWTPRPSPRPPPHPGHSQHCRTRASELKHLLVSPVTCAQSGSACLTCGCEERVSGKQGQARRIRAQTVCPVGRVQGLQLFQAQHAPSRIFPGHSDGLQPSGHGLCAPTGLGGVLRARVLPSLMQEEECGGTASPPPPWMSRLSLCSTPCRSAKESVSYLATLPARRS